MLSLHSSPLTLTSQLVSYPSVTPSDGGIFDELIKALSPFRGVVQCLQWGETKNLYIRWGAQAPHLCFAGHVDVVPPGPEAEWLYPPFQPTQKDGYLYGRGVADMKGAIGCFLFSLVKFLQTSPQRGSYSILLTSDEEGAGLDGIQKMIPWLQEKEEHIDHILIGEPTGSALGEVLQIGRRGSVTGTLTVSGTQGHIAYPDLCNNPVPRLVRCLSELLDSPLDKGNEHFEPSYFSVIGLEPEAVAMNVSPSYARAQFGVRFNPIHNPRSIQQHIQHICEKHCSKAYDIDITPRGGWFITEDHQWISCVENAILQVTGSNPRYTTRGGATDGRFLHALAPVLEVGLPETTMHQANERVLLKDFITLSEIYTGILNNYGPMFF